MIVSEFMGKEKKLILSVLIPSLIWFLAQVITAVPISATEGRSTSEAHGQNSAITGSSNFQKSGEEVTSCSGTVEWPEYSDNPFTIPTSLPPLSGRGGLIVNFFTNDCLLDYAISQKDGEKGKGIARIAVYDHYGSEVWKKENISLQMNALAENYGLPGWNGPGISAGDVDGDGKVEIVHLDTTNQVIIRNGQTGDIKKTFRMKSPGESNFWGLLKSLIPYNAFTEPSRWGMVQVVNLRGQGPHDAILQSDPLPFDRLMAIRLDTGKPLWSYNDYIGQKHGGFRTADIDSDGRDEVLGVTIIDDDGTRMNAWNYPIQLNTTSAPHIDAIHAYDIDPNIPGLEIVLLEEYWGDHKEANHTALINPDQVIWRTHRENMEPQNTAIGEFDLSSPGLEIWSRSRFETDQKPWVYNAQGRIIASYDINNVKPDDWSEKGIEFIYVIDWDGHGLHHIAAKERHVEGKIAVLHPLTGEFIEVWKEVATHLFVADVAGDTREEIIVFNNETKEIRVYWNPKPGPGKAQRLWRQNHYQRAKDNYNYYSP